ncbi:DUF4832 domain-containing protein [Flavobacterium sp. CYK-55]|uniref:T9SS type A sorting domain-containing protein n=1 Tax=Flavobacterium sp. CYK-55 TaxID=2835529 RepID=UPI001BCE0B88|nr:DUF4832 domain-containing protein [Flavobacterium sp. CYK-55]MBS7786860.1 DUF4832 domain-containing protein [Flavobacterium sp. CYK-55]
MKNKLSFLGLLFCMTMSAQNATVNYIASDAVFPNPERGFYRYSSAHTGAYNPLDQSFITSFRTSNNITLIHREFRLRDFLYSPISESYLTNVQNDFNKIRNAGLKCIIRFVYSNDDSIEPRDATKQMIQTHIGQLAPLLQNNSDIIALVQAGFIGAWGEWYATSQAEFGGYGYNHTDLTSTNIQHRKDIITSLLNAIPTNRAVQLRYPAFKMTAYSTNPVANYHMLAGSVLARLGHHNDCFLATDTDYGTYDDVAVEYPYLELDTRYTPMGGETCLLNSPRTDCTTAISEMKKFHWSFLNADYNTDVIDEFIAQNCYSEIEKNLGYRFQLISGIFPQAVNLGNSLPITLKLKNLGYAAPFNERKAYLILKNTTTNTTYSIRLSSDPRLWLGPNEISISENLTLPSNIIAGTYKLYLSLPDSAPTLASRSEYAIRFANNNMWESTTGFNNLNFTLNISPAVLANADFSKLNVTLYPNPASEFLTVEMDQLEDYQITFYNALGQKINLESFSAQTGIQKFSTANLSDGMYFIDLALGNYHDTRKIIIRH